MVSQRLIAGHHQGTLAVLALQVDRQAQVGVRRGDRGGLAVDVGVVAVEVRELLDRLHQRVAQQVGEGDLAAAGALELVVDDDPVVDQQLGRDGADAGRRRHVQRRGHVLHDGRGGAAQRLELVALCGWGEGGLWRGRGVPGPSPGPRRARRCRRCRRALGPPGRAGRRRRGATRWRARGCSRRGTRASSGRPTRGRRGTCGTSPRPATRFARMVKFCSRPLFASIPVSCKPVNCCGAASANGRHSGGRSTSHTQR